MNIVACVVFGIIKVGMFFTLDFYSCLVLEFLHSKKWRVDSTRENRHACVSKKIDTQQCGNDTFACEIHTPAQFLRTHARVISTRISVILTRSSVISTRMSVVLTRTSVISTRMSVFLTRTSGIFTRMSVILTRKSVVFTLVRVI
jgi:hypothetical protein